MKSGCITLLDGDAVKVTGCRFVGATLWTDHRVGCNVDPCAETGEHMDIEHEIGA